LHISGTSAAEGGRRNYSLEQEGTVATKKERLLPRRPVDEASAPAVEVSVISGNFQEMKLILIWCPLQGHMPAKSARPDHFFSVPSSPE